MANRIVAIGIMVLALVATAGVLAFVAPPDELDPLILAAGHAERMYWQPSEPGVLPSVEFDLDVPRPTPRTDRILAEIKHRGWEEEPVVSRLIPDLEIRQWVKVRNGRLAFATFIQNKSGALRIQYLRLAAPAEQRLCWVKAVFGIPDHDRKCQPTSYESEVMPDAS